MVNEEEKAQNHFHMPGEDIPFLYNLVPETIIHEYLKTSMNCNFFKLKTSIKEHVDKKTTILKITFFELSYAQKDLSKTKSQKQVKQN